MNLRHMEVFHAVYANGSVSAAARLLNVSQPSISKVLAHAELDLGFQLFRRLKGRLIPTEEAHLLFREVDQMHGSLVAARATARNLRGGLESFLRLSVLPSLGLSVAPAAIRALLRSRPQVRVDVQTLHHDEVPRALIERECDLAIGFDALQHPRLHSFKIGRGELVLVHHKDKFPQRTGRIALSTFSSDDFISVINSGPVGDLLSSALAAQGIELQDRMSVRTFYVAAGLVRAGAGFAVIDEFTARATQSDDVAFLPLDPPLGFDVHCIFLIDRPPTALGKAFIEAISAALKPVLP